MASEVRLPDPAVIVLAGASGAGKSTWAAARFRRAEIVSSDALREVLGSGPADLDASADAFDLLGRIVAARTARRLTTVVDTLGLDPEQRLGYLRRARDTGLPAVLVLVDTPAAQCRERNRRRDRPVPSPVLTAQLRRLATLVTAADAEGWDLVVRVTAPEAAAPEPVAGSAPAPHAAAPGVVLQVGRFPWGDRPGPWLRELAVGAEQTGAAGLALMDHLIQIPQVGRAWNPIPEPWVTLGFLAGASTGLRLGTLVSPVTFRAPGLIAKTAATLDVLSGGRAFCGLGAGWWAREHAAYGLEFPPPRERLDRLQTCIETLRALWGPGTRPHHGAYGQLPETTAYPRPVGPLPIIVGGTGARTRRIVAEQADATNLPVDDQLPSRIQLLRDACAAVGRRVGDGPGEVAITVLDVPVVGRDRDDAARRVERLRGRTPAAAYAARHHAGVAVDHAARYQGLADLGVTTVFCALPDLDGPDDLDRVEPLLTALR